jgi:hypothetical protein
VSGQFARLQQSLHRAHPTTLNQRIEVFANDLNAILEHYVAVSTQSAHDADLLRQALEMLGDNRDAVVRVERPQYMRDYYDPVIAALKERLE